MDVRRARPEDAHAIAQVHAETWREAYEHVFGAERLASVTVDARLEQWERILTIGQSDVFVVAAAADDDPADGIVGFVSTGDSRDADAEAELFAIYVLPDAWGSGAGSALMRAGVEAMRLRASGDAVLWVLDDNPRARRFYEREGWTLDGERKEDEYLGLRVAEVRYRIGL
jgi:ribosomal protein S18 acetylase RimI-like enzyme